MADPVSQVVPATEALARRMAPHLRATDVLEVQAAKLWTPEQALLRSLEHAPGSCAWLLDGEPALMWGVEPVCAAAGLGVAWTLGTDAVTQHPLMFWRLCKAELARLMLHWQVLFNWIDARYEASIRWAWRLGFVIDEPKPFGAEGRLFCCAALVRS
jgi:hypothetical protein